MHGSVVQQHAVDGLSEGTPLGQMFSEAILQ